MSAEEEKLRLFVALAVPPEVKTRLVAACQELRRLLPSPANRWTTPENWHLTLRFLGNVEALRKDALTASLAAATAGFGPLHLVAEGAGCFPNLRSPRVLWIGVRDAGERLTTLRERIVTATESFTGEPVDDPFIGHVTLARIRLIDHRQVEGLASFVTKAARGRFGEWTVDRIQLMRSELLATGSRHSCLVELPLQDGLLACLEA